MGINDGQRVRAAESNAAWASKTSDNTLTGKQTLNRPESGTQVVDVQQAINDNISDIAQNTTDIASLDTRVGDNETDISALQTTVASSFKYQGAWDANANSPSLSDGTGTQGHAYAVTTAGSQDLGSGSITFTAGDFVVHNGSIWQKIDGGQVASVNGQTGAITLNVDDLNDVTLASVAAYNVLRRNSGNTAWENFNPYEISEYSGTGIVSSSTPVVYVSSASLLQINSITAGFAGQQMILINRTGDSVTIGNQINTDANDIITGQEQDIEIASNAALFMVYDNNESAWQVIGGTGGGSASGGGLFESDITTSNFDNWVTYKNTTASIEPETGTGGSPTVLSVATTIGNAGSSQGVVITKSAANAQGEGVALDYVPVILHALYGFPMVLSCYVEPSNDFTFGDSSINPSSFRIFLRNVDTGQDITLSKNDIEAPGVFQATFQYPANTNADDYRAMIHCADTGTTSTLSLTAYKLTITPALNQTVNAISDWVDGGVTEIDAVTTAPTKGTTSIDRIKYKQVGDEYLFDIQYLQTGGGSAGSGVYLISLPDNLKFDSSVNKSTTTTWDAPNDVLGLLTIGSGEGGSLAYAEVRPYDETRFYIYIGSSVTDSGSAGSGTQDPWGSATYSLSTVTVSLKGKFSAKIKGATSGYSHPAQIGLNARGVFEAKGLSGTSIAGGANLKSFTTIHEDSLSGWNNTTGEYTVKSAGDFVLKHSAATTAAGNNYIDIKVNGVRYKSVQMGNQANGIYAAMATLNGLKYGDIITVVYGSSKTFSAAFADEMNWLSIYKLGSQSQSYAPRECTVRRKIASGATGDAISVGSYATVPLSEVEGHQDFISLNTGTYVMTLQPGVYNIKGFALFITNSGAGSGGKFRLYDSTNSAVIALGSPVNDANPGASGSVDIGVSHFSRKGLTVLSPINVVLQGRANGASYMGASMGFGDDDTVAEIEFTKVL